MKIYLLYFCIFSDWYMYLLQSYYGKITDFLNTYFIISAIDM